MLRSVVAIMGLVAALALSFAAPSQGETSPTVRERLEAVQERLDEGLDAGDFTRDEAAGLQAELDAIRGDYRAAVRYYPLTISERKRLHARLDELEENIEVVIQKKEEFTLESLAGKKAALRKKIDSTRSGIRTAEDYGLLAEGEAVELRAELSDIEADLDNMVMKDALTPKKAAALDERLDGLSREVDDLGRRKKERPAGALIMERVEQLRIRISYSLRGGLITLYEARRLRADLRDVEADLERLMYEGRLAPDDAASLNRRLDDLSAELDALRRMPPRTVVVPVPVPAPPMRPYR
jgi:chromosome segregation ATPase